MTPRQSFLASQRDVLLLIARILIVILFILFGWPKLVHFSGTIAYMGKVGAPAPIIAAAIAVVMELLVGFYTRPLALLLALYTVGTALIGHHYWTMTGGEQMSNMIHFYKNIAITGGLLALCAAGPGRFSIDRG
ncbi:AraC family transcriptional regulator [Burkholderia ubonensis]|uniref:DoxX family protein n=1 Tax=Burkholderia ubonensis TaxID=101571 RepID=UPI00075D3A95|nr:AraC family transcriptional regulator [Burkholderia ubonensis]